MEWPQNLCDFLNKEKTYESELASHGDVLRSFIPEMRKCKPLRQKPNWCVSDSWGTSVDGVKRMGEDWQHVQRCNGKQIMPGWDLYRIFGFILVTWKVISVNMSVRYPLSFTKPDQCQVFMLLDKSFLTHVFHLLKSCWYLLLSDASFECSLSVYIFIPFLWIYGLGDLCMRWNKDKFNGNSLHFNNRQIQYTCLLSG